MLIRRGPNLGLSSMRPCRFSTTSAERIRRLPKRHEGGLTRPCVYLVVVLPGGCQQSMLVMTSCWVTSAIVQLVVPFYIVKNLNDVSSEECLNMNLSLGP